MASRLIIDGNSVYEIDEDCEACVADALCRLQGSFATEWPQQSEDTEAVRQ